jgi:TolB protein
MLPLISLTRTLLLSALLSSASAMAQEASGEGIIRGTAKARVELEEFSDSLGATATNFIRTALEQTGNFQFGPGPTAFKLRGTASGGRIVGTLVDSDGKLLFSETYDHQSLRMNALQFTDEVQSVIFGRPGIGMTQIAFVSDASGHKEIYVCDADGSNVRQLTNDQSICVSPALRNDAVFLAFTSYKSGYPNLYMIDLRSNSRRRIINAPGTNSGAAFSPEGEQLAMTMSFSGNPELYVTNPGGLGGRRLTESAWAEAAPTWSPDGKRIAYVANPKGKPQLFVIPAAGGVPTLLATGYQWSSEPNWSPDGHRIASTVRHSGKLSIAISDVAGGRTKLICDGEDPCWGADARHLIFVRENAIILRHVENETERVLISNMGRISEPTWSR